MFYFHIGFDGYFCPLYQNYHLASRRYRCCDGLAKEEIRPLNQELACKPDSSNPGVN